MTVKELREFLATCDDNMIVTRRSEDLDAVDSEMEITNPYISIIGTVVLE